MLKFLGITSALLLLLGSIMDQSVSADEFHLQKLEVKKFVVGPSIVTSNENWQAEVPPLWIRFYQSNLAETIPNRINQKIVAVYSEYEGDYTNPFRYLIGCEVSSLDDVPEGMIGIEIPAVEYAVFDVKGDFPLSMIKTWQYIWGSKLNRSYTTDYEVYPENFNPFNLTSNPEISINIAVE